MCRIILPPALVYSFEQWKWYFKLLRLRFTDLESELRYKD